MSVTFKIPKISLFNIGKATKTIMDVQRGAMDDILITVQRNVKLEAPVGHTGQLRNNIFTENLGDFGKVFATAEYAPVIEFGRRAAPVSRNADLIRWIRLSTKGQAYFSGLKQRFPKVTLKGAAFLLRRSMKRKARKANPFFEKGFDNSAGRLKQIEKETERELKRKLLI